MSSICKYCWTPRVESKERCRTCIHNFDLKDHYLNNPVTCKFGYQDCIHDPGYIFAHYPDWYRELYGDKDYTEAAKDKEGCGMCSEEDCHYDDEDK